MKSHDEPMLLEIKDDEASSRKRLSRVISDFNVEKEDKENTAVTNVKEAPQKEEKMRTIQ